MLKMIKMKKVITLALIGLLFWSCQPDPYKEIGEAYSVVSGVNGTWELAAVEIEDRSFPQWETLDVTEFFTENPVSINFKSTDNTYAISATSLDGLPFTSMNGQYTFDDEEYPTSMFFIDANSDTTEVSLGGLTRSIDPNLVFESLKSKCETEYARYIYTFNRN